MLPEGDFDREALFLAFGRFVDSLGGVYVTCEDSGTSTGDMDVIARETRHVLGTSAGSGDPSPFTAIGCRRGIEAAVEFQFGRTDLAGMHVAIQGVGHVGHYLATQLHERGARLTIADVNEENLRRTATATGATMVGADEILAVECDVLAPCALGAVFDDATIPTLRTKIIGGAANNVLAEDRHGLSLQQRGILYAPDYVINAGGLINVATEYRPDGYARDVALAGCDAIHDTLMQVFERARSTDTPTHIIADQIAEERIFG